MTSLTFLWKLVTRKEKFMSKIICCIALNICYLFSKNCKNFRNKMVNFSNLFLLALTFCIFKDYHYNVSILPTPSTHHVIKHKHLANPTHPLFCLRNNWMVPKQSAFKIQVFKKCQNQKACSKIYIIQWKDSDNFWHRKLTLKVRNCHF